MIGGQPPAGGSQGRPQLASHRVRVDLTNPTAPSHRLDLRFNHARGKILALDLTGVGQPVTVIEIRPGSNAFRLTWATPGTWSGTRIGVTYVGERPALLGYLWQAGSVGDPIADAPPVHTEALARRLKHFVGLAQRADSLDNEIERLLRSYGAWPGRGRVVLKQRTERGFEVLGAPRSGLDGKVLDPPLGAPPDWFESCADAPGPSTWHMPIAEQLQGLGLSDDQIAAGHSMLLDVLSHQIGSLRSELGIGAKPGVAVDLGTLQDRLQVRVVDRALVANGRRVSGLTRSLEGHGRAIVYFSALQRDLDQWYFGPLQDPTARATYARKVVKFSSGDLRLLLQREGVENASNTEPDSAFFFFFAEFAAAAVEEQSEEDHWMGALPALVAAQEAYRLFYAPQHVSIGTPLLFKNYQSINYLEDSGPRLDWVLRSVDSLTGKPLTALHASMGAHCGVAFRDEVGTAVDTSERVGRPHGLA